MPEMLAIHHLPEMFDARRILPDEELREILDRAHDGARVPFEGRLAPAEQAGLVGLDLDEDPVSHPGMADEGSNGGDFHGMQSKMGRRLTLDGLRR